MNPRQRQRSQQQQQQQEKPTKKGVHHNLSPSRKQQHSRSPPPSHAQTKSGQTSRSLVPLFLFSIFVVIVTITLFSGIPSVLSRRLLGGGGYNLTTKLFGKTKTMTTTTTSDATAALSPFVAQPYKLLEKTKLSPDSFLLKYEIDGRSILGIKPDIPTCIKVDYPDGTDAKTNQPKVLSKSYSPVSHPNTLGRFDLIVKSYPLQPGGGVGKYICDMEVGDSITAKLKKERIMHSSPIVEGRWKHVGLIAGGTGIAPLLQLARILLDSEADKDTTISLLFVNRHEYDILGHSFIDQMVQDHPKQFKVTYALTTTNEEVDTNKYETGRGTVEMARKALPPPSTDNDTMIFICGKDGFVAHWGGPVARGPKKPDGSKGPKIQGPLLGVLKEAGYTAEQVFKY